MGGCVGYSTYKVKDNRGYNLDFSYRVERDECDVVKGEIPFEYVEVYMKRLIFYRKDPYDPDNYSDDEASETSVYNIDTDPLVIIYFDLELLHQDEMWGVYKDQLRVLKCKDDIVTKFY